MYNTYIHICRESGEELTRVGHGDFVDLIGMDPAGLAALEDAGGQPLLKLQRYHRLSLSPKSEEFIAFGEGRKKQIG